MLNNIINLEMGNVFSINSWLSNLGIQSKAISSVEEYKGGNIIIPGVCNTAELYQKCENTDFCELILDRFDTDITIFGICAGFQMLTNSTEEGEVPSELLGLLPLETKKLHMSRTGWEKYSFSLGRHKNIERKFNKRKILNGEVYFNHRYGVFELSESKSLILTNTNQIVTSAFYKNCIGVQFHPEKSGAFGNLIAKVLR